MTIKDLLLIEFKDSAGEHIMELIAAAIDVNLAVPANYDNELNRKMNRLEKAIKDLGYDPRKRLKL